VAFACVAALTAALAWRTESSLDVGFHAATGRFILARGAWPATDPFTYTVPDHAYVDMHGLFQILLALVDDAAGGAGIAALRVLFVIATLCVMWHAARRRGVRSPLVLFAMFALGVFTWERRFFTRPELASALCLALQLALLHRHAQDGRRLWLGLLVPLQLVWVNAHALSLFGPATLGLYATCSLLSARTRTRDPWIALAAVSAAMLANPYGLRGVAFLWELRTRLDESNVFAASISELRSPFASATIGRWPRTAFIAVFAVTGLATLARARRLGAFDVAVVALWSWLAATAGRNIGLYAIACTPIGAQALEQVAGALRLRSARPVRIGVPVVLASAAIVTIVNGAYYGADRRPEAFGSGPSRGVYPVRVLDTVQREGLRGPIYNHLDQGGYLIGALWPRERVFIDGRLEVMDEAFYTEYVRYSRGGARNEMLARYRPRLAIVPYTELAEMRAFAADSSWALIELDGATALFALRAPDTEALARRAAAALADLDRPASRGDVLLPRPPESWIARVFGKRTFPWEAWGRGNALYGLRRYEAARREYARALREARRDDVALVTNYAAVCYRLGRRDEARAWYGRLTQMEPRNRLARERLLALATEPR
jgi:hypothetical protein